MSCQLHETQVFFSDHLRAPVHPQRPYAVREVVDDGGHVVEELHQVDGVGAADQGVEAVQRGQEEASVILRKRLVNIVP